MPKPTAVLTSMRLAANANATLVFNVDLTRVRADTLKDIDHATRSAGSLEVLRTSIDRLLSELAMREAELKRQDDIRRSQAMSATYADEAGAE